MPPTVNTRELELALIREGVQSHVRNAILTLAEHVAAGLPLTEHSRSALGCILAVRPIPEPVHTYSNVRPPEVF